MKPSRIHYVLAHGFELSTCGTAIAFTGIMAWVYFVPGNTPIRELLSWWSVLLILLMAPLGWFFGVVAVWPFVGSIASKINGAPFSEGDEVRILVGQFKDQIVRVYEVWKERGQLRVDFGEKAKKNMKDILFFYQVCRHKKNYPAQRHGAGNDL